MRGITIVTSLSNSVPSCSLGAQDITDQVTPQAMNVSTLVHDIRQTSKFRSKAPSQRHITVYHPRGLETYERDMASALTASPYSNQAPAYARKPRPPPSPPAEDPNAKCTLPSIQSLIGMADDPVTTDLEPQRKSFVSVGRSSRWQSLL